MTTASMNPQERRICNFVKNNSGRTVLEIADAIDENPSTTKKRTPRLVEHGYLRTPAAIRLSMDGETVSGGHSLVARS
ncbi:winged helix-turn-helix DNA-binding family protein [Burkholderia pseudomallei MSHR4032]|uniref:winged helix-turn-helix domain-containing protein n=1 Tax=Burkholderia pseudomallei TaxID=28450 RepID=UPI000538FE59|nr:winged helix-turn-helix domain-containing protein [Burkholderia pseudomallei]KGU92195.1 winged helix-turn-helix DNA-binding family protein [Burkholderia pseudomallei MSHR4032]